MTEVAEAVDQIGHHAVSIVIALFNQLEHDHCGEDLFDRSNIAARAHSIGVGGFASSFTIRLLEHDLAPPGNERGSRKPTSFREACQETVEVCRELLLAPRPAFGCLQALTSDSRSPSPRRRGSI